MEFKQIRKLAGIVTFALILTGTGCSDSSTGSDAEPAMVKGRVESNEGVQKSTSSAYKAPAVDGAVVTAARIMADGELETINGAETETNAEGEFTISINMEAVGNASDRVIIMAEKQGQKWKAYITGELESGSTIELSPLTVESSGEASIYQQVIANGDADLVSKADIEAFVTTRAAAEVKEDTESAAAFAAALAAEARTRSAYFADQSISITEQQKEEIENAKAEALIAYNSRLYASTDAASRAEAYDTFIKAVANAYVNAGVNARAYAKAKEMSSHLIIENTTQLSTDARAEVRANAARIVAIALDNAVQARMEAASAAESSVQAAAEAGTKLRAEIKAMSAATESEVEAAFESYNAAIVDILQQEFTANATVISDINSDINSTGGIKATLESTISASLSTDILVQAYSTFYTSVQETASSMLNSMNDTETRLVTELMVLINIAN